MSHKISKYKIFLWIFQNIKDRKFGPKILKLIIIKEKLIRSSRLEGTQILFVTWGRVINSVNGENIMQTVFNVFIACFELKNYKRNIRLFGERKRMRRPALIPIRNAGFRSRSSKKGRPLYFSFFFLFFPLYELNRCF